MTTTNEKYKKMINSQVYSISLNIKFLFINTLLHYIVIIYSSLYSYTLKQLIAIIVSLKNVGYP